MDIIETPDPAQTKTGTEIGVIAEAYANRSPCGNFDSLGPLPASVVNDERNRFMISSRQCPFTDSTVGPTYGLLLKGASF